MIVETSLPNVFAILFVAKALECRHKLRTSAIRSLNIRRDRRPRLSVIGRVFILLHPKQKVDMVRHYYIFFNRQMMIKVIYLFDVFICYFPVFCQFGLRTVEDACLGRTVEDACPYNARKDTSSVLCANRYKIYTATIIIKTLISWCFSLLLLKKKKQRKGVFP